MELKVLAVEPEILASEPRILDFGAPNTGHWSPKYWPPEPHFWAGNAAGRCRNIFEKNEKKKTSAQIEYEDVTFYNFLFLGGIAL